MKKLCLVAGMSLLSVIGFSQQSSKSIEANNDTLVKEIAGSSQDRVLKLEKEVASLKSSQLEMQKQLEEIKSVLPKAKATKKPVVSRTGSKQVIYSEE